MSTINKILLISEDYIKNNSTVYNNVDPKLLRNHIFESQSVDYKYILPEDLYNDIFTQFEAYRIYRKEGGTNPITDEVDARILNLVDKSQPFLLYSTLHNSALSLQSKITNKGIVNQTSAESNTVSESFFWKQRSEWKNKSDAASNILIEWLYDNKDIYTELDEENCDNLENTFSCPLYLGDEI